MSSGPYKPGMSYYTYKPGNISCGSGTVATNSRQPSPSNLRAVTGDTPGTINLTWLAAVGADSYNLYQGEAHNQQSATPIAGLTGTTYQITGLEPGKRYYFKLKAVGVNGVSLPSNEANANANEALG